MTIHHAPWRVLAVGVVVNAVAVAVTVAVLPGVRENTGRPVLGYLALGLLFGLINALVKPAMQFVALPFLLQSMGVVVIIVDVIVFALLDAVTPRLLTADGVLPIVAAGLLLGVLSFMLDNLFGLTAPIVNDRPQEQVSA